ncbi:hypothetical protein BT96DRAFT_695230 [Gymnopus androsaceus JB14]|uniref:Uncharacterized protein n=1 Tax=Gymnopus androsaceus JB14 TaxID=1447944 RepID=A0A6A4HLJ6_9AGAR|nr:hypothetical protein BT96DRAFT_695230 [Gymnopus androsaceus JB14]
MHHSSKTSFSRGHNPGSSISSRQHHTGFSNHRTNGGSNVLPGAGPGKGPDRAPNFLSGNTPGDRRGRIAGKKLTIRDTSKSEPLSVVITGSGSGSGMGDDLGDVDTPRNATMDTFGFAFSDTERQRERDFLDSLRSPDLPPGGWGLGAGNESTRMPDEGEEDEPMDWDQAQAAVERMVGMNSTQQQQENGFAAQLNSVLPTSAAPTSSPPVRRRMT